LGKGFVTGRWLWGRLWKVVSVYIFSCTWECVITNSQCFYKFLENLESRHIFPTTAFGLHLRTSKAIQFYLSGTRIFGRNWWQIRIGENMLKKGLFIQFPWGFAFANFFGQGKYLFGVYEGNFERPPDIENHIINLAIVSNEVVCSAASASDYSALVDML